MLWQRAGHRPIALVGGATGLIGDPSFKDAERPFLDAEQVEENAAAMAFGPLSDDQMQQVDEILGRDSTG